MLSPETLSLAQQLWDYHHLNDTLIKSDCILALGSHDLRVAVRAAELYLQGWAPLIIMSGGLGNFTKEWTEKEADRFAAVALERGVTGKDILIENRSTNSGENILFTQKLLEQKGLDLQSFIVVQKPYMERRSYATFKKQWPGKDIIVTSPHISFEDYPTPEIPIEKVINIMVGDLQRIKIYPEKDFIFSRKYQLLFGRLMKSLLRLGLISILCRIRFLLHGVKERNTKSHRVEILLCGSP